MRLATCKGLVSSSGAFVRRLGFMFSWFVRVPAWMHSRIIEQVVVIKLKFKMVGQMVGI